MNPVCSFSPRSFRLEPVRHTGICRIRAEELVAHRAAVRVIIFDPPVPAAHPSVPDPKPVRHALSPVTTPARPLGRPGILPFRKRPQLLVGILIHMPGRVILFLWVQPPGIRKTIF
jgi:hypothetical protein